MLLNVRAACFLFFFFFWLIVPSESLNRSESLVHRLVTLTIERIHSTQVSRPYWSRYLSSLLPSPSSPPHPHIPYYVFLTLSHNHPIPPSLSLFFHRTLSCVCTRRDRACSLFDYSRTPPQWYSHDILSFLAAVVIPGQQSNIEQIKERIVIANSIYR